MKSTGTDRPADSRRPSLNRPLPFFALVVAAALSLHFVTTTSHFAAAMSTAYRETYTDDAVILEGKGQTLIYIYSMPRSIIVLTMLLFYILFVVIFEKNFILIHYCVYLLFFF